MFDTFLSCLLFSVSVATLNAAVQMLVIGRNAWLLLQDAWMAPMSAMTGIGIVPVFLGSVFMGMLANALMLWLLPILVWTYVVSIPFGLVYMIKAAKKIRSV